MGTGNGTLAERRKAIGAKVGAWTIDAESGEKKFVYGKETD